MKTIMLRYGELTLKGKNRSYFEKVLLENVQKQLAQFNLQITKDRNRIYVRDVEEENLKELESRIKKIPGIHSYAIAKVIEPTIETIIQESLDIFNAQKPNFRVSVKRLDKKFPINSSEFAKDVGAHILRANDGLTGLKVSMKEFDQEIKIEIHKNEAYIFNEHIKAMGGLPIGTAGKAAVLLSGGIDSPVAAIQAMKRGLKVILVHYSSPPHTSDEAFDKIKQLVKVLHQYDETIKLINVNIKDIQEEIYEKCDRDYQIILIRKMMMRIAQILGKRNKAKVLVTGENLAQVASQTIASMTITNSSTTLLVLRPLITYDKIEIIELAKSYGTYEISILPFEDSCTVFMPQHPIIHPKAEDVDHEESKYDFQKYLREIKTEIYTKKELNESNELLDSFLK